MWMGRKAAGGAAAVNAVAERGGMLEVLRLIRSRRVGPTTFHRLIAEHGTAEAALAALPEIARAAGIADYTPCPTAVARNELLAGLHAGARPLSCFDPDYPEELRQIADAPPFLWIKGNPDVLARDRIAVIGARNASSLGLRMTRRLAIGLGEAGVIAVAGLARGIDTAAHEATLATGTIAVLAGGIDQIYPEENRNLAEKICEAGLLVSEQPPGLSPTARHFPTRNRIISGLSRAVVVVEAAERSGSLITARMALDQGREVLAVPGHPLDARASGCNALIRDGAALVRSSDDLLATLGIEPTAPALVKRSTEAASPPLHAPQQNPSEIRQRILAALSLHPGDEDAILRELDLCAAEAAPVLMALELSGEIRRMGGGQIHLAAAN